MKFMSLVIVFSFFLHLGCTKRPETSKPKAAQNSPSKIDRLIQTAKTTPSFENFINLGLEYSVLGRSNEAIVAYKKAVLKNEMSPLGWNNLCAEYNNQKMYADAISHCERAIFLDAKLVLAHNNLKLAQEKLEQQKKTILEKHKNWSTKPNLNSEDLISIGMDFYIIRSLKKAVSVWTKVKPGDPLYSTAQNNLASSYIHLGELKAAEKSIALALQLEPKNELFANNRDWLERVKSKKSKQ